MVQAKNSKPKPLSVTDYLKMLPVKQREVVNEVRKLLKASLPEGLKEQVQYGMLSYVVPLKDFPGGYLGNETVPLPFASLASQKNHYSLYLFCLYEDDKLSQELSAGYKKIGKKLDMGKSCLRFKAIEDLDIPTLQKVLRKTSIQKLIKQYKAAHKK